MAPTWVWGFWPRFGDYTGKLGKAGFAQYIAPVFTGIIETTGELRAKSPRGPGARLAIATTMGPLVIGESIAVHGVCLTVQTIVPGGFECDASSETLARSILGAIPIGGRLHLERALAVGDRLGGHIVTGHVDGRIRLKSKESVGEAWKLTFEIEDVSLARYVAPKGSVTVNGVSLTVNGALEREFDVVIIPHTLAVTTLGTLLPSHEANLEVDLLARYVGRLLGALGEGEGKGAGDLALLAKLKTAGFV